MLTGSQCDISLNHGTPLLTRGRVRRRGRMLGTGFRLLRRCRFPGDVNGSGKDDIIADFGSTVGGIFVKRDQGAWVKLHNMSPDRMATGNLDRL